MSPRSLFSLPARPLRLPLVIAATYFVLSQLLRYGLAIVYRPQVKVPSIDYVKMVLAGLHIDAVVALCLVTPLAIWQLLKVKPWEQSRIGWLLLRASLFLAWCIGVFSIASEWFFFDEFQSRYNTVAIDYLIYPKEVVTNLWESFPLVKIILAVVVIGSALWLLSLKLGRAAVNEGKTRGQRWLDVLRWAVLITLAVLSIQRAETAFSHERTVNELANNGLASGMKAALTRNLDYAAFYPSMDRREAFLHVRKLLASPGATFVAPEPPEAPKPGPDGKLDKQADDAWVKQAAASLQRRIPGDAAKPKLNLVILLQESLGSEFFGCLGRVDKDGKPATCTPKLDRLTTEEGMLFDNLFADGNRTIRGIEAVMSSFPPLPGDSILARDRTENVESVARVLKRDGYDTLFLYSGKGTFDYIESYSLPNGWDRLIQEWDFKSATHRTAWGVCDEDMYHRAIDEMRAMHASGKPFFVSTLGVSNHLPFTFPAGRITDNSKTRKAAVRYADWAIWDFIRLAKREAFWQNTIFAIVADHGARVYGSQTIPSKSYMIPMYLVGGPIKHQRVSTLGCQLDVAPTLLGLIGRPYDSLFFGHDLLAQTDPSQSRCVMHHNRSIAVYRDQRQVIFGLNKSVELFTGDPKSGNMVEVDQFDDIARQLQQDGTALFQVADELYMHEAYRVQPLK